MRVAVIVSAVPPVQAVPYAWHELPARVPGVQDAPFVVFSQPDADGVLVKTAA